MLIGFVLNVLILEPLKGVLFAYLAVWRNPRHEVKDWIAPIEHPGKQSVLFTAMAFSNKKECYTFTRGVLNCW